MWHCEKGNESGFYEIELSLIAFAAGLAALMLLTGCSLDPLSGTLTTPPPDSPTYQPVSPSAENAARSELRANLLF